MFTNIREVWSYFTGFDIRKYIKMWERGFALLILFLFIKYPVKMKQFGLTETKLFHSIFQSGGSGGGTKQNTMDPPLNTALVITHFSFK